MKSRNREGLLQLIKAARSEIPVDLLIKNCQIVNVFNGLVESCSVAVHEGIIVGFGDRDAKETIDIDGLYLVPGMIDGHIHIESSMVTPAEFSRVAASHGTSAVVADPHEIANVLGLEGILFMLESSRGLPVDFYFMIPSCVPATHMETSGARIGISEMKMLKRKERILGLAEMMDYPGVIHGFPEVLEKLTLFQTGIIDGHGPGISGGDLDAYLVTGIRSDHECTRLYEAEEKLAKGMWIMIREGSQSKNLSMLAPIVNRITFRRCMLVSDDRHPDDLLAHGHLDAVVNKAIEEGIDPITAIQMVTINPAQYFGLRTLGAIAPGFKADFFTCESLNNIEPCLVFKKGKLVAEKGRLLCRVEMEETNYNLFAMRINRAREEDFALPCDGKTIRVIQVFENQIYTREIIEEVPKVDGMLGVDIERDILKIAVLERHKGSGRMGVGYVKGFGLKEGALASSVAHDSHNIIVVGCDDRSMATAVNALIEQGGGLVICSGTVPLALLPLPVAGLFSVDPLEMVVSKVNDLNSAYYELGGILPNPFMALSFLALPVIPELRITDMGLVDVRKFDFVPLFASK